MLPKNRTIVDACAQACFSCCAAHVVAAPIALAPHTADVRLCPSASRGTFALVVTHAHRTQGRPFSTARALPAHAAEIDAQSTRVRAHNACFCTGAAQDRRPLPWAAPQAHVTNMEQCSIAPLRMQCLSQNGLTAYRRFYLQFSLIDMVVSAKNSSSSTPVRSRVNVSPVRISAPAACSHTSREAMRCGTCSAQRTAHSAQRTAHSITHCGLSCRHSACGPQAHAWLPTGCTSPGRPEERPALPVTSTARHGTARHGTARHGTARAANVQRAVARRYANELPTSHSPVPRAQPRGPVPHSACVPHRLVELLRAVRFGLGVRLAQIRREPRSPAGPRTHARTVRCASGTDRQPRGPPAAQ